jgi:MFS family permease
LLVAPGLGAIRADINRQVGWAKDEARRQTRYVTLTGVLAGVAALAVLGAVVVGLVALYLWLSMQADPFIALAVIGGGLLLLAVLLFALAFVRRRPQLAARPRLQIVKPAALLGTLRPASYDKIVAAGEPALKLATDTMRQGTRSALLGTLLLVTAVGLIAGRRLQLSHRQTIGRRR